MKKIYSLITSSALILVSAIPSMAQCGGGRYHDFVFPTAPTVTSSVVYGSNLKANNTTQSLLLDVYRPAGDTYNNRALIILAHGGSFVGGSKTGTDVVPLAKDLAKMGYVVASMEYRVGMTNFPFSAQHQLDSTDAGAAVMRAVHDGRAAVRFFRKNAAVGGNTYGIDPNQIYFAGVSAGGFIALHIAYMDQWSEFPNYIDTTGVTVGTRTGQPGLHGGLEGASGNPGYPSNVNAIVNICGALGDTATMHAGDIPVLSFHGTNDGTVPYGSALIYLSPPSTFPLLEVDGSASVAARANQVGIVNCFKPFPGADHVPEVGTTAAQLKYYDTVLVITRNYLEHFTCGVPLDCNYSFPVTTSALGVNDMTTDPATISIYPNPANTSTTIDLSAFSGNTVSIELYDALGRKVKNAVNIKSAQYTISRDNLPTGIYFMKVISNEKSFCKKIIFE
jgi:para-nitrobenzyl esterase